jgi:hypothetical protein
MSAGERVRVSVGIPAVCAGLMLWASAAGIAQMAGQKPPETQAKPQTPSKPIVEPFRTLEKITATTVNLTPGGGENISITVSRWSEDADRDKLMAALNAKAEAGLHEALTALPTVGYLWTSEVVGYPLRYAHHAKLPDGTERILLATDRPLGSWTRGGAWKAAGQKGTLDYPFTLIELRVRRGTGEGKMSLGAKVVTEAEGKVIALENYAAAPVLLKGVRRENVATSPAG